MAPVGPMGPGTPGQPLGPIGPMGPLGPAGPVGPVWGQQLGGWHGLHQHLSMGPPQLFGRKPVWEGS